MNKPKILLLSLWDTDLVGLSKYFDVRYYNYKMPLEVFYERVKGVDLIIEHEFNDGKSFYSHLLKDITIPKAMWFVDRDGVFKAKPDYIDGYDFIFMAIDGMRTESPRKITHLPLAYHFPIDLMERTSPKRNTVLSFIGNIDCYSQRKEFFKIFRADLDSRNISHTIKVAGWRDYADAVQDSFVAFNKSSFSECNYRVFESLGFGGMLLTDHNDECIKIPTLSERAFFYKNYDEIFMQIERILSIPSKKYDKQIKDNQKWILNNHLLIHRYLQIAKQAINYENKK